MKKFFWIFSLLMLSTFTLTGCGSSDEDGTNSKKTSDNNDAISLSEANIEDIDTYVKDWAYKTLYEQNPNVSSLTDDIWIKDIKFDYYSNQLTVSYFIITTQISDLKKQEYIAEHGKIDENFYGNHGNTYSYALKSIVFDLSSEPEDIVRQIKAYYK